MSRKIDELIARYIMGWTYREEHCHYQYRYRNSEGKPEMIPCYSSNIQDAWQVVEKMNYLWFQVGRENCSGVRYDGNVYNRDDLSDRVNVTADTPAMAICLAALKVKGIDVQEE